MCKVTENQLKFNSDQGTPLVCSNKCVGLLSVIIPPGNGTNSTDICTTKLNTKAYYTRVSLYVDWIHSVIGNSLPPSTDGKPNSVVPNAPPFHDVSPSTKPTSQKGYATSIVPSVTILLSTIIIWMFIR